MRLKLVPEDTHLNFIGHGRKFIVASLVAMVAALAVFLSQGLNFGVDFRGGALIEIRTEGPADLAQIRGIVGGLGLGDATVQEFGEPEEVLIQIAADAVVEGQPTPDEQVLRALKAELGEIELRRVEFVGPKVSGELIQAGILAVLLSLVAVMVYVWLRFEWQFAVGAVASLAHDVLLTIGLFSLIQLEFNLSIVAALLTIVGYSLNDTVVVYDRVRENLRRYKAMPMLELLNLSVNETLSRTMMTSITTLIALIALYTLGGEVIRGFTFGMIWGIVIGTYSSIFIAAMIVMLLGVKRDWSKPEDGGPAGVQFGAPDTP
ncbi:MAG: protein translocase subunit SecF [Pikeienuella sp.]|uniref:protein translocase subunit SecF n=1 Tax=Pikeienuella sp. TaxID=2831957 RepID=UPI00391DB56B